VSGPDEEVALQRRVLERVLEQVEQWLTAQPAPHECADAGQAALVQGLRR
jgi:hypothetical protein